MPKKTSSSGSELFIVDNSDEDWKVLRYLHDWCQIAKGIDIATGYFEIGSLLSLKDEWQKVDHIRILMGDECSMRTKAAFEKGLAKITAALDASIEEAKEKNDFLVGVPAIVDGIRSGKIQCRVYRKAKFHAKAYITHARLEVVGSAALVGSSNFTAPGITENIELNVQITGAPVSVLQEWYEDHWNQAEDVTAEILRVIEKHVLEYSPFEVYAKSLYELFADATPGEKVWDETQSRMFNVLDGYQQDGYRNLMKIGEKFGGALLCDGVGLGKTFVGLMLIERLIVRDKLNVLLLAPKGALESVWQPALQKYLKKLSGRPSNLVTAAHTDLGLQKFRDDMDNFRERIHAIVIDEAHHFRNPGVAGTGVSFLEAPRKVQEPLLFPEAKRSRYRELFDIIRSPDGTTKKMFMLTATPINNSFHDLRHMIELFTQKNEPYFAQTLGIHSLTAHFKRMEKKLDPDASSTVIDDEAARAIMARDPLVGALVVQRSRAFVKEKQRAAGAPVTAFPHRQPPHRVEYSLKKVYGRLLEQIERAFDKATPLFTLSMYYPLAEYKGPSKEIDPGDENRQMAVVALIRTGFLKRFESSVEAFRTSCERLLARCLQWITVQAELKDEKARLAEWRDLNVKLIDRIIEHQPELFGDPDDDEDEDLFEPELLEDIKKLPREDYRVEKMLEETYGDLEQLVEFLTELEKFDHRNDDKLKALLKLLRGDPSLSSGKVLIFSEFADTARYLFKRLTAENVGGLERIDGRTKGRERLSVIRRFSPYYNGVSSAQLAEKGEKEIRVLISTDVLSEGLNLQDAARLINYDLHWNPVRLMQRIGRVDRRRNPEFESHIALDHPELKSFREEIAFFNFLPPDELNRLLTLYSKVTRKTLRISKALGIEGKKLLKEDDDYQDLQHFNETYEGTTTDAELLELEKDKLFTASPELVAKLKALPLRTFSGKKHPTPGAKAVFFCYRLPALREGDWTTDGGPCRWLMSDLDGKKILEEPSAIAKFIRSTPQTPRITAIEQPTLRELRKKIEDHMKNTYLKAVQAPVGVKPILKAWMELN